MSKIQSLTSEATNNALSSVATFMVNLGTSAVSRSAFPFWHYEVKMPQSMMDEVAKDE